MDRRLLLATQGGTPSDYLLSIPFQNSINDVSGNYTMIPGNVTNAPNFVAGRKGTDYCAYFDGTKSIKTNANFVTGTDKISLSAWLKFTESSSGTIVVELGNVAPTSANNLFDLILHASNQLTFRAKGNAQHYPIFLSEWYHIVVTADLSLSGGLEINFYVNSVLHLIHKTNIDQSGNFANAVLHIGQRGGNTQGFKGYIQDLQVYNRVLSAGEALRIFKK